MKIKILKGLFTTNLPNFETVVYMNWWPVEIDYLELLCSVNFRCLLSLSDELSDVSAEIVFVLNPKIMKLHNMINSFTYDRLYTNVIYMPVYCLMSLRRYQEEFNCQQVYFCHL